MLKDKTDPLDIYWYVTDSKEEQNKAQIDMLKDFVDQTGKLPKWNK